MSLSSVMNTSWGFGVVVATGVVVGVGLIGAVAELIWPRGQPSVHEVSSVAEMKQLIAENERVIVHLGSMQYVIQPIFRELSAEFDNIKFLYVDIDRLNKDFRDISKVPTFRLFHAGIALGEMAGADIENLLGALGELAAQ